jgi:hypothetical protein
VLDSIDVSLDPFVIRPRTKANFPPALGGSTRSPQIPARPLMAGKVPPPTLAITLPAVPVAGPPQGRRLPHPAPRRPADPSTTAARRPKPVTLADARQCAVTHPNGATPPGVGARRGVNHGNTKLWTAMWQGGVSKADPDYVDKDGSIHMKFRVVARGQRTVVDPGRRLGKGAMSSRTFARPALRSGLGCLFRWRLATT